MTKAIGYIRQSRRADVDIALSEPTQRAAILRMAEQDGFAPDDVTIRVDLGRSGSEEKTRFRSEYAHFMDDIVNAGVTNVYALSMSRVARSLTELTRFYKACVKAEVSVRFEKEGEIRFGTSDGKLRANIIGSVYEFERDLAVERAKDNVKMRRAKGLRLGRPMYHEKPGNQLELVVKLFKETASLNGTARKLNELAIPSPLGRSLWSSVVVRKTLERGAPDVLPAKKTHGAKPSGGFRFYRLLKCPCGKIMTGSRETSGAIRYRCHGAGVNPGHQTKYLVREDSLVDWIKAELALLGRPAEDYQTEADSARRLGVLNARRARISEAWFEGDLEKDVYKAQLKAVDDKITAISVTNRVRAIPAPPDLDDVDLTPATINATLREIFEYVELDTDFRPVWAEWTEPAWRQGPERLRTARASA